MNWPGEAVLNKVIDVLQTGVGGVLRPWQIRRVGKANTDARAAEMLRLQQVEFDIAEVRAGRKTVDPTGKLISCDKPTVLQLEGPNSENKYEPNISDFAQEAKDSAYAQDLQRAVNLKKISIYAEEIAEEIDEKATRENYKEENERKIDPDWFQKWRTGAQEVSREEMQRLWGKLLSEEVSKPGSYSLHTVDFLSRMSSDDANLLAKFAPFTTSGGIIRFEEGDAFFADKNIRFSDFLYLDDLGIINGTTGIGGLTFSLGQTNHQGHIISNLLFGSSLAMVFYMGLEENNPGKLSFEVYPITKVGKEILNLASIPPDFDYIKKVSDKAISLGATEVQLGNLHPNGREIISPRTIAIKQ